jgi:hypothetical protein
MRNFIKEMLKTWICKMSPRYLFSWDADMNINWFTVWQIFFVHIALKAQREQSGYD